jgi:hypothetical protein
MAPDPLHVPRAIGGVDHQQVMVGEAVDEEVVEKGAALVGEGGILRLPHLDATRVVGGKRLDEMERAVPPDLDLSHVRNVEQTRRAADGVMLGGDSGGVLDGHLVARERNELSLTLKVLGVERSAAEFFSHGSRWSNF